MAVRERPRQTARREALLAKLERAATDADSEIMRDHWIRLGDAVRRVVAAQHALHRPSDADGEGPGSPRGIPPNLGPPASKRAGGPS